MHNSRFHRGVGRCDVLVALACAVVFIVTATVVFGQKEANPEGKASPLHPKTIKDGTQLRGIHQSFLVFSREFNGIFPRPGLINRLADPVLGQTPGRGPEDTKANTTANLYSSMIMNNFFTAEIIVSPVERNPKVHASTDYNYEAFDVKKDVYWDSKFKADLKDRSDVSYAHMPLFGKRMEKQWRDTLDAKFAPLGNRGPKDGAIDPSSFTCGPHGQWAGNIVFNDNHGLFQTTVSPADDNLFATDNLTEGIDSILSFTKEITDKGPVLQFD